MKLRTLYSLIGAAWGLLLGVLAGIALIVFAYGVSWLYIFGDSPWPEAAGQTIIGLAYLLGLFVFFSGLWLGYNYGKQLDQKPDTDLPRFHRRGYGLFGLWVLTVTSLIVSFNITLERQAQERTLAQEQASSFEQLLADTHTIERISFSGWENEKADIVIFITGNRSGDYRLSWSIQELAFDKHLDETDKLLSLETGASRFAIELTLDQLKKAYSEKILNGAGGVLVEESFQFVAILEPVLTSAETRNLPPSELQNFRLGFSPLYSISTFQFPVTFTIP